MLACCSELDRPKHIVGTHRLLQCLHISSGSTLDPFSQGRPQFIPLTVDLDAGDGTQWGGRDAFLQCEGTRGLRGEIGDGADWRVYCGFVVVFRVTDVDSG